MAFGDYLFYGKLLVLLLFGLAMIGTTALVAIKLIEDKEDHDHE